MILGYGGRRPDIAADAFVAPNATVIGDVRIGAEASIWFGAVLRGDRDRIEIGARTNVQDNATVHLDPGHPTVIGDGVTIGHAAIVHGCTVGANCLVGMGATILTGARIGHDSIVGAHALVTEHKEFAPGSLIIGVPARVVRALTEAEIEGIRASAAGYVAHARTFSDVR